MPSPRLDQKAPLLSVSDWVQGSPTNFDQLTGKVVLVEVFQVNCPGCFLYSLPHAIALQQRYSEQGLVVLGVATAFEDFDKNNLTNLNRLVKNAEVVGETLRALEQNNQLQNGKLPYRIPFPLAMDSLQKRQEDITNDTVSSFIDDHFPNFKLQQKTIQEQIRQKISKFLQARLYHAKTFELFSLQGTPSHIVVDKKGILRACEFGAFPGLEELLLQLIQE